MSKKAKPARARREKKKTEKAGGKPQKPRRAAPVTPAPPEAKPPEKIPPKKPEPIEHYLIAVRLDGTPGVRPPQESTLRALRMNTRFSAVMLPDKPPVRGMLQRVKDHVTWGDAKMEDLELLLSKRARTPEGLGMTDKFVKKSADMSGLRELIAEIQAGKFRLQRLWEIGVRPIFRLHPPRGGFRKSSKRPFADGGELGYRRDGLTDLLAKMC